MSKNLDKDFDWAGEQMNSLLDELEAEGVNTGAAMGGALTALLFRLMVQSPDSNTTMGMLSSAMNQAATIAAAYDYDEETKH